MQREYTINIMKLLSFPCNAADQIKVYLQFTIIVLQFELTKINNYTMVEYPSEKLKSELILSRINVIAIVFQVV